MSNWSKRAQEILDSEAFLGRVATLAAEAARAGDHDMVAICDTALGIEGRSDDETRRARDEVARVLAEVQS
jgi:hypothetical protein